MAIQIPNPGTGNGATGDNEFVLWSKVKDNFNNTTHAANRLVGTSKGNLAELTDRGISGSGLGVISGQIPNASDDPSFDIDANNKLQNGIYAVDTAYRTDNPDKIPDVSSNFALLNISSVSVNNRGCQIALPRFTQNPFLWIRSFGVEGAGEWVEFYNSKSASIYATTTAIAANVVVDSSGKLMRGSSSERYKDIIADLELDDENYADAMSLNPIIYRSKSEIDNPNHHFYSFSAEALGAYDPAFTLWRDTETITDDEGNTSEQPLDERVAEGINLNAIVAFLHATNVKQGKLIDELSARIGVLEDANK